MRAGWLAGWQAGVPMSCGGGGGGGAGRGGETGGTMGSLPPVYTDHIQLVAHPVTSPPRLRWGTHQSHSTLARGRGFQASIQMCVVVVYQSPREAVCSFHTHVNQSATKPKTYERDSLASYESLSGSQNCHGWLYSFRTRPIALENCSS